MPRQACPTGPARAGSRLQIQCLINEHPELLNEALRPALTDAPADAMIQWVSPLAETDYAEYRDEAFLSALGLGRLTESLVGNYWPRGGPCWDALATVTSPGDPHFRGVILVEAKSHTPEVYGTGCLAGEPSLTRIRKALALTADALGTTATPAWEGRLYQTANRLAHLQFLRNLARIPAWLVDLSFVGDPYRPTSRETWQAFLPIVWHELGLDPDRIPGRISLMLDVPPDAAAISRPAIAPRPAATSILAGVDDFVDRFLGVADVGTTSPHYRHKTSCLRLSRDTRPIDGPRLVRGMYDLIAANWPGTPCRGKHNWRLDPQTNIGRHNTSREKTFEKFVATHCPGWTNMVPVASGMLPDVEESGRRIDLVLELESGAFEFIELKLDSDTPLFATIEILGYGLLYVHARLHRTALGYLGDSKPLLNASHIGLRVLAPQPFYAPFNLRHLEVAVSSGVAALSEQFEIGCTLDFRLDQFSKEFRWPNSGLMTPCQEIGNKGAVYQ